MIDDEDIVARRDDRPKVTRRRKVAQRGRGVKSDWENARTCVSHNSCPLKTLTQTTGRYVNTLDPVNPDAVAAVTTPRPTATVIADAPRIVSLLGPSPLPTC